VLSSGITHSLLGGRQSETIKKKNETLFLFPSVSADAGEPPACLGWESPPARLTALNPLVSGCWAGPWSRLCAAHKVSALDGLPAVKGMVSLAL
jgi:hypothetical protein